MKTSSRVALKPAATSGSPSSAVVMFFAFAEGPMVVSTVRKFLGSSTRPRYSLPDVCCLSVAMRRVHTRSASTASPKKMARKPTVVPSFFMMVSSRALPSAAHVILAEVDTLGAPGHDVMARLRVAATSGQAARRVTAGTALRVAAQRIRCPMHAHF